MKKNLLVFAVLLVAMGSMVLCAPKKEQPPMIADVLDALQPFEKQDAIDSLDENTLEMVETWKCEAEAREHGY